MRRGSQSGVRRIKRRLQAKPDSEKARVLVADGDHGFRRELREELELHGYEVLEAADGTRTLEMLATAADDRHGMPDAVVLEVRMSGYSGLGVLGVMQRFSDPPPAVVVSHFIDPSIEMVARRLGAVHVLRKPVDLDHLLAAVLDAALRGSSRPGIHRASDTRSGSRARSRSHGGR
jgi:DNA-binding response OmpR family regulator